MLHYEAQWPKLVYDARYWDNSRCSLQQIPGLITHVVQTRMSIAIMSIPIM